MWGCIATESSYQLNFNTGFSNTKSDVLIHLAQWQYWWWFWFAFLWSFYYLVISKIVRYRTLKMRPKIVTSYRPHGKWGDFLAAIIPGLWCLNILTNSNFILRLIEWQNESSLFLIRVRARQWYWVYKFELKNFTDILTTPKNIGRNKWQLNTFGDLSVTDDYLHVIQLRSQNRWIKSYWDSVLTRTSKSKQHHSLAPLELFRLSLNSMVDLNSQASKLNNLLFTSSLNNYSNVNYFDYLSLNKSFFKETSNLTNFFFYDLKISSRFFTLQNKSILEYNYNIFNNYLFKLNSKYLHDINFYSDFIESSRYLKKRNGVLLPLRLIKLNWSSNIFDVNQDSLFRFRFSSGSSSLQSKNVPNTTYMSIKQKRYERKKNLPMVNKYLKDSNGNLTRKIKYSTKNILLNNSIFEDYVNDPSNYYRMLKKNKKRSELISVNLAKRILRTKRTLVLPAHTNITLITNSFDIVHSWFIPGLGIKLDCVPGRSTHHTFYIDNVGFYYGQCAEICGRYHHHMPIRVCALPFEHFLVWWHTFGLPKLIFTNNQRKYETYYSFRKYIW